MAIAYVNPVNLITSGRLMSLTAEPHCDYLTSATPAAHTGLDKSTGADNAPPQSQGARVYCDENRQDFWVLSELSKSDGKRIPRYSSALLTLIQCSHKGKKHDAVNPIPITPTSTCPV